MDSLDKYSNDLFFPRKQIPPEYYPITENGVILFVVRLQRAITPTKQTLLFFHGNGELVEVILK